MGRISFVLVLVLVSTIGGGCYKIGGIKIENCVTTDCNELFPTVEDFELNCTGCGGLIKILPSSSDLSNMSKPLMVVLLPFLSSTYLAE